MALQTWRSRIFAAGLMVSASALLAGCDDQLDSSSARSLQPIPQKTLAKMDEIGTTPASPVLIRTYKQEAELQIWKLKSDGQYALLKTFPMCRWSGQLGPKTREGDRQVPEGFYTITPGQMNPHSNYYLSFNVGYPNAYDRAYGRTGGTIMVHGACSSAGCYSMTDQQIAEIYAIAREAFNGGQREIQMQSYPFKMTAENLAKHRLDPNIAFWKELKNGSDHFEVTQAEPSVLVCGKHYVFGAVADHDISATAPCPTLHRDSAVEEAVAAKEKTDDEAVAALVAKGVKPIELVYADGGQNPAFANVDEVSRPDALAAGPQEIVLDDNGKPIPTVVKVAAADASKSAAATSARGVSAAAPGAPAKPDAAPVATTVAATTPAAPAADAGASPLGFVSGVADGSKSLMTNLFTKVGGGTPSPAIQVFEPQQPIPTDVPLPPKRAASLDSPIRMADVKPDAATQ